MRLKTRARMAAPSETPATAPTAPKTPKRVRNATPSSVAATRMKRRREQWGHCSMRRWTPAEFEDLIKNVRAFGYDWTLIARIMDRSPDSLRNKLVRFHKRTVWAHREAARAWLKRLVAALQLREPECWGRKEDAHISEPADLPAPTFVYRKCHESSQ